MQHRSELMDQFMQILQDLKKEWDRLEASRDRIKKLENTLQAAKEHRDDAEKRCRELYERQGQTREQIDLTRRENNEANR